MHKIKKLKKAVFPVGGLGTRFLPATKSLPKEMLPVDSKPLIQHIFEEAKLSGIEEFIFITGRNKNAINNHFDHSYELQNILSEQNKHLELELAASWLPPAGSIAFVRQYQSLGLGHAIWCARNLIGNEPFAVLLADELLLSDKPMLKKMIDIYHKVGGNVLGVLEIDPRDTPNYGIVGSDNKRENLIKINHMVEKPAAIDAPSNLAIIGRYILQPEIFKILEKAKPGIGGEIQITDSMNELLAKDCFYGVKFDGKRFDCGKPMGFLEANIAYAARNNIDELQKILKKYLC